MGSEKPKENPRRIHSFCIGKSCGFLRFLPAVVVFHRNPAALLMDSRNAEENVFEEKMSSNLGNLNKNNR